ncbi:hypothetical protein ACM9HB_35410, partial [Streptomyces sp. JAC128]
PCVSRRLLTFIDNRHTASLQAGHFSDFVTVTEWRWARYRAAIDAAGPSGLVECAREIFGRRGVFRAEKLDDWYRLYHNSDASD